MSSRVPDGASAPAAPPPALAPTALAHVARLPIADPLALPGLSRRLRLTHLVWDEYVAGQRRVDLHPLVLTEAAHEDAKAAALAACAVIGEVARLALTSDDEAALYGFSAQLRALARASHRAGDHGRLVRVDLLLGEDDRFRACEINADCPGGLNEAHGLPDLLRLAGFKGRADITPVLGALAARLVAASGGPGSPKGLVALVFATAYAEDLAICALVERAVTQAGGRARRVGPTALAVDDARCTVDGEPVSVLYRFYPSEHLAELPIAAPLAAAIAAGNLTTLSSFAAMFEQSKLAFARACALEPAWREGERDGGGRPGDAELRARLADAVAQRLPYTTLPREAPLLEERSQWVLKRALGRVGDEVFVGALEPDDEWARLVGGVRRASEQTGDDGERDVWIAQRFLRQRPVSTPWGPRLVTLGAYVLDGEFQGYFARLTEESHTSHDALVVPVVLDTPALRRDREGDLRRGPPRVADFGVRA
ncbi:MAG: glutathionylspermidine synthase family protein [Myxococcales bacterium]|nr:glutathionylspermidine synthase family protein [Myxococcales bacterium]